MMGRKGTYPTAPKPKPRYYYSIYHLDGTITRVEATQKWTLEQMQQAVQGNIETVPSEGYYDRKKFPGKLYANNNGVALGMSRNPHFPGHPHYGLVGPVLRYATEKQEAKSHLAGLKLEGDTYG